MLDTREAQDVLEDLLRDTILYALGRRAVNVASVAALRAALSQGMTGPVFTDDSLAVIEVASVVTAAYRWSQTTVTADNGSTVVKPNDVDSGVPGRWVLWTSTVRFSPTVGADSVYLHEIAQGPLQRVIVLDRAMSHEEITGLITGQVPSVLIEAKDDSPDDMTMIVGHRWDTRYAFTISVIAQNLRDRRQHAHGSVLDATTGANLLDGMIKALLAGNRMSDEETGIRSVEVGRGLNWFSSEAQRRVIRSRDYSVIVTEENPPADNDTDEAELVATQAMMTDLGETEAPFDMDFRVVSGITVPLGVGLTKNIAAGSAVIDGTTVAYAGQSFPFTASKDTYRDLLPNGTLAFLEVAVGAEAPAVTPTSMRIGLTRTDGSSVLSDTLLAASRVAYKNPVETSLE